ncbi:methyl-accepting chemotaxis protein [Chromatiaceae bacterium AAb-1]|nr:methyl-accepting chemotaxis protein [Chromatiaceae bacterium AAb-1]
MLSRLRISARVLLLGTIPLFFLGLVLLASFWAANAKDRLFYRLYDDHLVILTDIMSAQRILQQSALQDIRKYRTGWASVEGTQQSVQQQLAQAGVHWQAFSAARPAYLADNESSEDPYQALDQAFERAVRLYEEWISLAGSDALLVKILNESTINNDAELRITAFGVLADEFIQNQITKAADVRDEAAVLTGSMLLAYLVGGSLLFVLVSGVIWAVQRSVSKPLLALRNLLLRVEQQSDLTLRANEQGGDEIAEAARALNTMIAHFQKLVNELGHSSRSLSGQAVQLYDVSEEVNAGAGRQAMQANQLAAAIEQMSSAVRNVAENALAAAATAQQAEQLSLSGRQKAAASVQTTDILAQQLATATKVISRLQHGSREISGVLDVIRNISEQTNLLALNAAIEAARAGEAGRGFSVVADEVRTLSANTQQATESIRTMIVQLQEQANTAVDAMQQASEQAGSSAEQVMQTDQMFRQIADDVARISQVNIQISAATEQQRVVTDSIAGSITLLNDDINQLTQGASRSASASEMLNQLAEKLAAGWQVFKTGDKAAA